MCTQSKNSHLMPSNVLLLKRNWSFLFFFFVRFLVFGFSYVEVRDRERENSLVYYELEFEIWSFLLLLFINFIYIMQFGCFLFYFIFCLEIISNKNKCFEMLLMQSSNLIACDEQLRKRKHVYCQFYIWQNIDNIEQDVCMCTIAEWLKYSMCLQCAVALHLW